MTLSIEELRLVLDSIAGETFSRKPWTRLIKESLCRLAACKRLKVCASECGAQADYPEWLYDVVWLNVDEAGEMIDSPLIVESELDKPGAVSDDFQKLLLGRAEVRLMIYRAATEAEGRRLRQRLCDKIPLYKRGERGDRYLFACYCGDTRRFDYYEVP